MGAPSPLLYALIEILTRSTEPCLVTCRVCRKFAQTVEDLPAAQRLAWSHDAEHWRGAA